MGLGTNNSVCINAFVEAMRAQLMATDPDSAHKVDNPIVKQNFEAFGDAVFRITVEQAEVRMETAFDPDFWQWLQALQAWVDNASNWQQGMQSAFETVNPNSATALADLRNAVIALSLPGPVPPAPDVIKGRIR